MRNESCESQQMHNEFGGVRDLESYRQPLKDYNKQSKTEVGILVGWFDPDPSAGIRLSCVSWQADRKNNNSGAVEPL